MSRNALVTGCNAGFMEGALTLLRDVRRFHPDVECYCIVPQADVAVAQARLGPGVRVIPPGRRIDIVDDRMQPALFKLFTPTVPADVVVWVDSDMVLCRPAPELWDVRAGEVVAVMDTADRLESMVEPSLRDRFRKQFGAVIDGRGLNGGLFAMRADEWKDLPDRYERAFIDGGYVEHPKIWDQPFLNGLMQPRVRYLPYSFNAHHVFDHRIPPDVRLVHFTSLPKPWMAGYPKHEPAYYYWLRYGLGEQRALPLAIARARIWARSPRRLLSRYLRARRTV